MESDLEKVCKDYKLSEEEHKRISNKINEIMLYGKVAQPRPVAIIDVAPPGSGKTGLNGMGLKQFSGDNAVVINSDELKLFHPKVDEVAKVYPHYYTKVTNQDSNSWTDSLFESAVDSGYNIIFEGTGRNLKLLQKMLSKIPNYRILVRGMAVNELNCLMSIIERYEGQLREKGWGRLVTVEHFYKAYEEMLDTIQKLEESKIVDFFEVYMRGEKATNPLRIYRSDVKEFKNIKLAVISGREQDRKSAERYFENNFSKRLLIDCNLLEEKEVLEKINNLYNSKELER